MRIVVDVSPLSHPRTGIGNYIRGSLAGMAAAAVCVAVNHILLAPMLHFFYSHSFRELGIFSFESLSTDLVLAALGVGIGTFWVLNPWLLPFAVAPKARSQSASVNSSAFFGAKPSEAALTSRSRPPSSEAARATSARASSGRETSPSGRPAASTDQPASPSRLAIAEPTRPLPPVTRARICQS